MGEVGKMQTTPLGYSVVVKNIIPGADSKIKIPEEAMEEMLKDFDGWFQVVSIGPQVVKMNEEVEDKYKILPGRWVKSNKQIPPVNRFKEGPNKYLIFEAHSFHAIKKDHKPKELTPPGLKSLIQS